MDGQSFNVSVLIWDPEKRRMFLVKRQDDEDNGHLWGLPGGGVHLGEGHLAASRREVFEETLMPESHYSLEAVCDDPGHVYWELSSDGAHFKLFFLATLIRPFQRPDYSKTKPKDPDIKDGDWVSWDDYQRERQFQVPLAHQRAINYFLPTIMGHRAE